MIPKDARDFYIRERQFTSKSLHVPRSDGQDILIDESEFNSIEEQDYTEMLGSLNLEMITEKDSTKNWIPVLHPDSAFKIFWDMIGLIAVLY